MASTPNIVLIGGGGHALVVGEAARQAGMTLLGVIDDASPCVAETVLGLKQLGSLAAMAATLKADTSWIICMGDLAARHQILTALGLQEEQGISVLSPQAFISPLARVGRGTFVAPRAVLHTAAMVGTHCIINTGAIIEHECQIGSNSHIAPGATLGGRARVGAGTLIGLGATILPGIRIGNGSTVGAGAVVVRDVEDGETVVGVPAHHSRRAW